MPIGRVGEKKETSNFLRGVSIFFLFIIFSFILFYGANYFLLIVETFDLSLELILIEVTLLIGIFAIFLSIFSSKEKSYQFEKRSNFKYSNKSFLIGDSYSHCLKCGKIVNVVNLFCENCVSNLLGENSCLVCKKVIRPGELIGCCRHCQQNYHLTHLKEVVKIRGTCPACGNRLREEEIVTNGFSSAEIINYNGMERVLSGKPGDFSELTCIQCGNSLLPNADKCSFCGFEREKCEICKKWIHIRSVIGICPHCQRVFHYAHILSAVGSLNKCPACKKSLQADEIRISVTG